MSNTKQLKIGIVLSYLTLALSNIIALIYTPFMLRMLGQSEYGLYSLVASVVAYLTILDFGFGFYTTTNKAQAISFADKVTKRRKNGQREVSIYEINENIAFSECSVLRFDGPGEAWLDFVSDNRSGNYEGDAYDFIFGPVANDDVYRTFTLYAAGVLTKEQTLEQLKIKKLYNQLVLTTEKALSYLRFVGTVPKEEF